MPSAFACQMSSTAFATGLPSSEVIFPVTQTSSPFTVQPWRRSPPYSNSFAPCAKNGPSTVASVAPGTVLWLRATIIIDRPRMSDSRMNSWRLSSHFWPTAVRNLMPSNHSSSVSSASRAKACRCFTALAMIWRKRGSSAFFRRATTASVRVSSVNWRMASSWKGQVYYQNHHATRHVSGWESPRQPGCARRRWAHRGPASRAQRPRDRGGWAGRPGSRRRDARAATPGGGVSAQRRDAARADPAAAADARLPVLRKASPAGLRRGRQAARDRSADSEDLVRAADLLPSQPLQRLRHGRGRALAPVQRAHGLRAGIRLLHRKTRQGHPQGARPRAHLRLHRLQRLLRSRRTNARDDWATRAGQRQGLRQLQRDRALPGDRR